MGGKLGNNLEITLLILQSLKQFIGQCEISKMNNMIPTRPNIKAVIAAVTEGVISQEAALYMSG